MHQKCFLHYEKSKTYEFSHYVIYHNVLNLLAKCFIDFFHNIPMKGLALDLPANCSDSVQSTLPIKQLLQI